MLKAVSKVVPKAVTVGWKRGLAARRSGHKTIGGGPNCPPERPPPSPFRHMPAHWPSSIVDHNCGGGGSAGPLEG